MGKQKKTRVLVADDSITIQKLVNLTMADGPFDVITALDGRDAQLKIKRFRPDIVLVDSHIREMSGVELAKWIKSEAETATIKIVMMRGNVTEAESRDIELAPIDLALDKPFDSRRLIECVQALLVGDSDLSVQGPPDSAAPVTAAESFSVKAQSLGPFSSFRKMEDTEEEETVTKKLQVSQAPFSSTKPDLSSKLQAIAEELGSETQPEPAPPWTEPIREASDSTRVTEDTSEDTNSQTVQANPASLSNAELREMAMTQISQWVESHLPAMAERILKEEFLRRSEAQ